MRQSVFLLALVLFSQCLIADEHPARRLIMETTEQVLERLRQEQEALQADNGRIYPLVEELILPHFDFQRMSAWVLGKHWRSATPGQRERFTREFQTLLVRTYAGALLEYNEQEVAYLPFRAAEDDRRVTVKTEIVQPGGVNIPLYYSLFRNEEGEWKVYDINIDGISLVTNYRSSFANQIHRGGIESLLNDLVQMNRQKGESGEQP